MQNKILDIGDKLENIKKEIPNDKKKYYHFRSVFNFIHHISLLSNVDSQDFVVEKLSGFVNYIESNKIDDVYDSLKLYNKYIKPIGELYELELGFFIMIKPWILNISILFLVILLYLINNIFFSVLSLCLLSIFCFYLGNKVYKKKVYSFMW